MDKMAKKMAKVMKIIFYVTLHHLLPDMGNGNRKQNKA